jgi:hypothetical protein
MSKTNISIYLGWENNLKYSSFIYFTFNNNSKINIKKYKICVISAFTLKNSSNTEIVCNYHKFATKAWFYWGYENKSSSGIMILFKIKAILNKINVL